MNDDPNARTQGKKAPTRRQCERQLINAALIWHAATVISGQDARDSKADKQLRRAATRLLKAGWKV